MVEVTRDLAVGTRRVAPQGQSLHAVSHISYDWGERVRISIPGCCLSTMSGERPSSSTRSSRPTRHRMKSCALSHGWVVSSCAKLMASPASRPSSRACSGSRTSPLASDTRAKWPSDLCVTGRVKPVPSASADFCITNDRSYAKSFTELQNS